MLVGGYTLYNTHWPNVPTVSDTAGGGQVVSNINDINSIGGSGHLVGGESLLLRRRLSSDSTARHDGGNVIWNGKFITYYCIYYSLKGSHTYYLWREGTG